MGCKVMLYMNELLIEGDANELLRDCFRCKGLRGGDFRVCS